VQEPVASLAGRLATRYPAGATPKLRSQKHTFGLAPEMAFPVKHGAAIVVETSGHSATTNDATRAPGGSRACVRLEPIRL
jgi:hypothetical protein